MRPRVSVYTVHVADQDNAKKLGIPNSDRPLLVAHVLISIATYYLKSMHTCGKRLGFPSVTLFSNRALSISIRL